jgi:hypothetical protein
VLALVIVLKIKKSAAGSKVKNGSGTILRNIAKPIPIQDFKNATTVIAPINIEKLIDIHD